MAVGYNEVPKAGGGHYVEGDAEDAREWKIGHDSNTYKKIEAFDTLISSMKQKKLLSEKALKHNTAKDILDDIGVKDLAFFNPTEYSREVHAEMSALGSLHHTGIIAIGATMYCTTFPCHVCAKHIISSGISRVVYIEPYPKSLAKELYGDSITVDEIKIGNKVQFEPFTGIAPKRYGDLFKMLERKDGDGNKLDWDAAKANLRYRESLDQRGKEFYEADALLEILASQGLEIK